MGWLPHHKPMSEGKSNSFACIAFVLCGIQCLTPSSIEPIEISGKKEIIGDFAAHKCRKIPNSSYFSPLPDSGRGIGLNQSIVMLGTCPDIFRSA